MASRSQSELFGPEDRPVRSVSLVRLSGEIARSFAGVGRVAVLGEVHRPLTRPNGRTYFTLRDRAATVSVSVPARTSRRCRAVAGERVQVTGTLEWLAERGAVQLVAEEVVPMGAGAIAALVAETRARLAAEGLLGRPRRPLPRLPATVGVVCGADAAVRADIESVVAARFPGYPLRLAETTVSGPGAAAAIEQALADLDARPDVEVIILARGGGDATQLLAWSDEQLCRAVAACATPVVSAIGHEGDRPLCDEVADARFGTPSIAAAAVVPSQVDLEAELATALVAAQTRCQALVEAAGRRLAAVDSARSLTMGLDGARHRLRQASRELALAHPGRSVAAAGERLGRVDWRRPLTARAEQGWAHLRGVDRQLRALSPERVLERGYAVVRAADGTIVRRAVDVAEHDAITIQVAQGRIGATVDEVEPA